MKRSSRSISRAKPSCTSWIIQNVDPPANAVPFHYQVELEEVRSRSALNVYPKLEAAP